MTYQDTLNYLFNSMPAFHRIGAAAYKASLETTLKLDKIFNHPHKKFKSIHVAGTNGKGSVSHIIASVLQSAGCKTGLFTSPHLVDFRERIKINGKEISEAEVIAFTEKYMPVFDSIKPSFFEMTAALAFDWFARQDIDVAVVEVGLGGRLDSTNIISPVLSVITNIGYDHVEFLGNTIAAIAGEKAGIIKPETPVIIGEQHDESTGVFTGRAKGQNAEIIFARQCLEVVKTGTHASYQEFQLMSLNPDFAFFDNKTVQLDLLGHYQKNNIVTALAAIQVLRQKNILNISDDAVLCGCSCAAQQTGLRGRWQIMSQKPLVICDTGHNAHGLNLSMQQLKSIKRNRLFFVFGIAGDKDLDSVLKYLPQDAFYIFTSADSPRAMPAADLAQRCAKANLHGTVNAGVKSALQQAVSMAQHDDVIFIGGSTYVVAEIADAKM